MTVDSSPSQNPAAAAPEDRPQSKNACVSCAQRKTKCDRHQPCAPCAKAHLDCIYRAPAPPQRRKRKAVGAEQVLLEKLRQHEDTLKSAGLPFEAFDTVVLDNGSGEHLEEAGSVGKLTPERHSLPIRNDPSIELLTPPKTEMGTLVADKGGQRYCEHGLIATLSREFKQDPREVDEGYTTRDDSGLDLNLAQQPSAASPMAASLILGVPMTQLDSASQPPNPSFNMDLWSTFLDNVDPLTKLLHAPSVRQKLIDATSKPEVVAKSTEALMWSISACAIASMSGTECRNMLGDSQTASLARYQSAAQHALLGCTFLKPSDLVILQAFVLLLTSMQETSDPCSLWTLIGVAIRIGQGLGLHRDGTSLGLPPFEVEMRRRLWWYIVVLDARATDLSGYGSSVMPHLWDTLLPLNVNDSDLELDMTAVPKERTGLTEMTYCLLRYETARFMQQPNAKKAAGADWRSPTGSTNRVDAQEGRVSELEDFLESKFLRFCDPVVPLHTLTTAMARSTISKLRHIAHFRRSSSDKLGNMSQEERRKAFVYSLKILEYDNFIHSTKSTQRFLWHVRNHFPWGALIQLLKELSAVRPARPDLIDNTWQQVQELYAHHPEFTETRKAINKIVGDLTLDAWAAREAVFVSRGRGRPDVPPFIEALRLQRSTATATRTGASSTGSLMPNGQAGGHPTDPAVPGKGDHFDWGPPFLPGSDNPGMSLGGMDWMQWGSLLDGFE